MKTEIIENEKILIAEQIQDLEIKLSVLRQKKEKIDFSTPFADRLSGSFYGGMVGYMNKKDNAKKSRELEKYINACNSQKKIDQEILKTEKQLKKLNTGNYLLRKNGLLADSYKMLNEKKESIEKMLNSGEIKGIKATKEEINILKDLRKETKAKIKQREK